MKIVTGEQKCIKKCITKIKAPNIITATKVCRLEVWACFKNGWYKDSKEVTGR
jgi:hypothetical protein